MKEQHTLPIAMTRIAISIFAVSQTMLAPLIVLIGADFDRGVGSSGFLFTAYYISNIFFCLVTGKIIALLGKHRAMTMGLAIYAGAAILFSRAESFVLACLCFTVLGAFATFIEAAGMDIVDALATNDPSSNLTMTHGIAGIGMVGGVLYSGVMLSQGFDWRAVYLYLGIAVAVMTVVYALTPFPAMAANASGGFSELRSIFSNKMFWPTFLALFLYVGAEGTATGWMATYMTESLGYTSLIASLATGLIWACVTAGRILCSKLVETVPVRRLVPGMAVILAVSLFLSTLVPDGKVFWLAVVGIGVGLSGMWPLIASTALGSGDNGGTIMSVILFAGYFGAAVIPYLTGLIGDAFGMKAALLSAAVIFLICGAVVRALIPRELSDKQHKDTPAPTHPAETR